MSAEPLLQRIRVVLLRPQHPGNIGAAARAMKTMGLSELALVAPHKFPHAQADAMAADAKDVLESAEVFPDFESAVADCARVAGTSARLRSLPHTTRTAREWAGQLAETGGRIALVFGPERTGLSNDEMHRCDELVTIPANPEYGVLNVAQAVQVFAYEVRLASGAPPPAVPPRLPVDHAELERFYEHLERVMVRTGFLDPKHPKQLMPRLRRLFGRAAPDQNEVNILRGILTAVEKQLDSEN